MSIAANLRGIPHVPVRHILFAVSLGAAVASGSWFWSRSLATDYVSSALLSFETPQQFLSGSAASRTDESTVRIADAVLSPPVLEKLAAQLRFASDASPTASGRSASEDFRAHFELTQPAPGLLQVTYRGNDERQVAASVNALAVTLAAWNGLPDGPPPATRETAGPSQVGAVLAASVPLSVPHEPRSGAILDAVQRKHRLATLTENSATLALQQQSIEHQISVLNQEKRDLEASPSGGTSNTLRERVELAKLRELRAEIIAERQGNDQQIQKLRSQLEGDLQNPLPAAASPQRTPVLVPTAHAEAAPVNHPPAADAVAKRPPSEGSFSIVDGGEKPHAVGDQRKLMLLWLGIGAAISLTALYLVLMAWRYRVVRDLASLRRAIPRGATYLGAVAGSPLSERPS
jgi:hypothetical protein